jgi:DNA polymerase
MPTRDDVLRELGLSPRWRLRDRARDDDIDTDPRRARIASLACDELVADIDACRACALGATRTCSVPGVGVQGAPWMFVGEAPGADEDAQGEPFVGAAGRLLDNMLAALGLSRERDVFIANVLKCRPPGNRAPEPAEADACRPYLDRQIELVGPTLIVALGKSAACTLLGVDAPVGSLRRRVHRYGATPLVVTYHPAYLLRTPADKAKAWEDLLFARNALREALTQAGKPAMPSGAGACAPRPQAA